ncbi:MAG: hypothetical protein CTY24_05705 [Methylobacter sp.]|nr:MAG: hypothetical protein CTY24_05705 [Methylobacter sp.]
MWILANALPEMLSWRHHFNWHYLLWAGQLGFFNWSQQGEKNPLWGVIGCAVIALTSLLAWIYSVRRGRAISDTPTSNIASAAQGYAEIKGIADNKADNIVVGKSGLPSVWFRCTSYRKGRNGWELDEHVTSDSTFSITDGSGHSCLVDPEGAEIVTNNQQTWYTVDYKYVEENLFPGEQLYVLGSFSTLSSNSGQHELKADVSHLLAEWKRDQPWLLERFDKNKDGKIDLQEWEAARQEAYRQVQQKTQAFQRQPDIHLITRPKNGLPFLISNFPEHKLRRHSMVWAWGHLVIFFAGLTGLFWFGVKGGFWLSG